ncbi:MAG TPA: hypothetical protein VK911_13345 [Vicinamibacterales bacterium]|nr:hypothetical protein [Vicinamibacterales bacterium]
MKTLHFATTIHAARETVWETMLGPDTFKLWAAEFAEGSYFEGSWAEGERIRFLAPDGSGVTSVIAENRPHEFLSIKHLGFIKGGVEDTDSEEVRSWAPSFENYLLSDAGSSTGLQVDIDVTPEFEEYMTKTWPKALATLKVICEGRSAG